MQRHGHQDVGGRDDLAAGTLQPSCEMYGHVGAVTMFQFEHQRPAMFIIDKSRVRLSINRALHDTGAADQIVGNGLIQRQTADPTVRRRDEGETPEAGPAQMARCIDHRITSQALRRQNGIEQEPSGGTTRLGKVGQKPHSHPGFLAPI